MTGIFAIDSQGSAISSMERPLDFSGFQYSHLSKMRMIPNSEAAEIK